MRLRGAGREGAGQLHRPGKRRHDDRPRGAGGAATRGLPGLHEVSPGPRPGGRNSFGAPVPMHMPHRSCGWCAMPGCPVFAGRSARMRRNRPIRCATGGISPNATFCRGARGIPCCAHVVRRGSTSEQGPCASRANCGEPTVRSQGLRRNSTVRHQCRCRPMPPTHPVMEIASAPHGWREGAVSAAHVVAEAVAEQVAGEMGEIGALGRRRGVCIVTPPAAAALSVPVGTCGRCRRADPSAETPHRTRL